MKQSHTICSISAALGYRRAVNSPFLRWSLSIAAVLVLAGGAHAERDWGGDCVSCHDQRVDGDLEVVPSLLEIETGSSGTLTFNVLNSPSKSAVSLSDLVSAPFDFTVVNDSDWDMFDGNSYYVSRYNDSSIDLTLDIAPDSPTGEFLLHAQLAGDRNGKWGLVETYTVRITDINSSDCDFNSDMACNVVDLNLMLEEGPISRGVPVAGGNSQFDLDGNNVIDLTDLDLWLADAATENGLGSPYRVGDADLNGVVDVSDFNAWNSGKFTSTLYWDLGNFNGDGSVDVSDFNAWNGNKFTSSDGVAAVPEPGALTLWLLALCGGTLAARKRRR